MAKAERMIRAIDKRIDAVRREAWRDCDPDRITAQNFDRFARKHPAYQAIEDALFYRRGGVQIERDAMLAEAADAEYRAELALIRQETHALFGGPK